VSDALIVNGLSIERIDGASIVEDISFSLTQGELLGLVGESGCGKTSWATPTRVCVFDRVPFASVRVRS
jgi:ABC-type glutathione transport system ATPase component